MSCAASYVSGAVGSNECPAGSARIETADVCRIAAAAAGRGFGGAVTQSEYPRGCYYSTLSNVAYFNPDAVGAGHPFAQLLCAAAVTTGAPLTRRCADARVLRGARGPCV